jgi:hypothetical protein
MAEPARRPSAPKNPSSLDADHLWAELVRLGEEAADAEAAYELLAETRKVLLGKLTRQEYVRWGAHGIAEKVAYAHPEYEAHVRSTAEAGRLAKRASARYWAFKAYVELKRSEAAFERESLKYLGHHT